MNKIDMGLPWERGGRGTAGTRHRNAVVRIKQGGGRACRGIRHLKGYLGSDEAEAV